MIRWLTTAIVFGTLALALSGCPSYTLLSLQQQQAIDKAHQGKTLYLKQSMFAGPFFAYDDRLYVSERAFDERVLIESVGGEPILSSAADHILPMGTAMRIEKVELPNSGNISARKLKSPRHFVWVYLKKAEGETPKPYVLVLTQEFRKEKQFDAALKTYLLKENPREAFASRLPEVIEAIDKKSIVLGMRADALMRSRGYPDKIDRKTIKGVRAETWTYAKQRKVVLRNDVVESWEGFPDIPSPKTQPEAASPAKSEKPGDAT